MKKNLTTAIAAILAVSLTGCSLLKRENSSAETGLSSVTTSSTRSASSDKISSDTESSSSSGDALTGVAFSSDIPRELEQQYKSTVDKLKQELENTYSVVGDTYDSYVENKQAINDWYDLVKNESDKLFYDTLAKSIEYYKALAASEDREEYKIVNKAFDELYDAVDGDCMDYLYDEVYSGLFDDLHDKYYKHVLDDSDVTDDYGAWLDEYTGFYSDWLDAYSGFYGEWLDAHSDFYGDWLNVESGFYSKNFDVDSLIENAPSAPDDKQSDTSGESSVSENTPESSSPEESTPESSSSEESTPESSSSEESTPEESTSDGVLDDLIRPDVKEAIDSYEAFIDEYCDFMKKYASSENPLTLMGEYADYLQKLTEMGEKFGELEDDDLTVAENAYYTEVLLRCQKKLLDAANEMQD